MRDLPRRVLTRLYERRRRSRDYHGKTLVIRVRGGRKVRARADEMEAQRGARPNSGSSFLQETRRPQARDWISYRLSPEHPTRHRKAESRITQMHEPHRHPQPSNSAITSGEDQHHYRQNSSGIEGAQGPTVPLGWHGSNSLGSHPGAMGQRTS
jgi:hypothetical protein